ncbi:MAG TPA: hypothetical protein PLH94_01835 [Fimbriimonadaceae bacterium]|nr:hypothetical protein [Fimbriimonadaceae bacterium]
MSRSSDVSTSLTSGVPAACWRRASGERAAIKRRLNLQNNAGATDNEGMAKVTTSGAFGAPQGKMGGLVFVRLPGGAVSMRDRSIPTNPRTPAQTAVRRALGEATRLYRTLEPEEIDAWMGFARAVQRMRPTPSLSRPPRVCDLFVALTAKYLMVHPGGTAPRVPPATVFLGDGVRVAAEAAPGAVRFVASGANASGVVTELLLQRLASAGRVGSPSAYRSQGFVAFSGPSAHEIPVSAGLFLAAIRFVEASSGQVSGLVELGRVRVV